MVHWLKFVAAISRVFEELFPFVHYVLNKHKKRRELKSEEILSLDRHVGYTSLEEAYLRERLNEERLRAAALDEKTVKMTLSLSFGLAALGASATFLLKEITASELRIIFSAMIGIGLFYILASGYVALGALRTLPFYGYATIAKEPAVQDRTKNLADALARQETINVIRQLRNEVAYQALRNGLLLLFFATGVFVAAVIWQSVPFTPSVPVSV